MRIPELMCKRSLTTASMFIWVQEGTSGDGKVASRQHGPGNQWLLAGLGPSSALVGGHSCGVGGFIISCRGVMDFCKFIGSL